MALNSVNIMGNLTRDPELKYTPSGKSVCNLSIANNRVYTKDGAKQTEVSYFDVEVWGQTAENCSKYLTKGSGIIVEGRLRQDRWEQEGQARSRVRISAMNIHFLPKRNTDGASPAQGVDQAPKPAPKENDQLADAIAWDE